MERNCIFTRKQNVNSVQVFKATRQQVIKCPSEKSTTQKGITIGEPLSTPKQLQTH